MNFGSTRWELLRVLGAPAGWASRTAGFAETGSIVYIDVGQDQNVNPGDLSFDPPKRGKW
jgi:hypothetical protein